jgi:hypothetical protein
LPPSQVPPQVGKPEVVHVGSQVEVVALHEPLQQGPFAHGLPPGTQHAKPMPKPEGSSHTLPPQHGSARPISGIEHG